jgi:hypothetical protein
MKRLSLFFLAIISTAILVTLGVAVASAEDTDFTQRILPLDCQFEEVNDGLGTLHYLTPAECGVFIGDGESTSGSPQTPDQSNSGQLINRQPFQSGLTVDTPPQNATTPHSGGPLGTGAALSPATPRSTPLIAIALGAVGVVVLGAVAAIQWYGKPKYPFGNHHKP